MFVLHTLLIIQGSFHYCWTALTQGQVLFCSPSHQAELGKKLGQGTHLWQLTPADQVDIPHHMRTSSVVKSCGKKKEWKTFRVMGIQNNGICLPRWLLCMVQACFPWDDWTPACPWEVVSQFFGLPCLWAQLFLLFWLSSLYPWVKVSEGLCRA